MNNVYVFVQDMYTILVCLGTLQNDVIEHLHKNMYTGKFIQINKNLSQIL